MTWEPKTINFRIEKLFESIGKTKNSEKELLSILKVLRELNKEITVQVKEMVADQNKYLVQKKLEISLILSQVKQKILVELETPENIMSETSKLDNELPTDQTSQKKKILLTSLLARLNLTESEKKRISNSLLVRHLKISTSNS
jgi:hypothetical protein